MVLKEIRNHCSCRYKPYRYTDSYSSVDLIDKITVNLPDVKGRLSILKVHARNKKFSSEVNLNNIAQRTPGFSGADLANLLNEAAILAARQKTTEITANDISTSVDRIITGLEGNCLKDSRSKRLVAYHEIGHAITGTMLKDHDAVEKVTLIPRGQARGLTWFTPEEDQGLISRGQVAGGTLGGRAAEEIVFGGGNHGQVMRLCK